MKAVLIEIAGLRPGAPAVSLVQTLTSQPGVLHAVVHADSRQVTVLYDPTRLTIEEVRGVIERCGLHCVGHVVIPDTCPDPSTDQSNERTADQSSTPSAMEVL